MEEINFKEPFFEKILRYLRARIVLSYIHNAGVICDIGCGYNAYFLNKAEKYISKGYGIDKKVCINTTDKIIVQRAEFFNNLSFQNDYFDAVTMIAVIEHLKDYNSIIKEVYRILKPEGLLIITTPTIHARKFLDFLAFRLNILNKEEIKEHYKYFDKKDIIALLENNYFFIKKYSYFEFKLNSIVVAIKKQIVKERL